MKSTSPSSRAGRSASCCVLLNRCTSSTKTSVPRLSYLRRSRAPSSASRRSLTPLVTALRGTNSSSTVPASTRASVVLPVPGGPHRTSDPILPRSTALKGPPSPVRCGWPTTSSSVRGRSLSARGARRERLSEPGSSNRSIVGVYRALRRLPSGFLGVALVVLAALAVHAPRGLQDVLRVEAAEGAGLQDLIHGVLGDHHPLGSVRHRQRLVEGAVEDPDGPPSRSRTGQKAQSAHLSSDYYRVVEIGR